MRIFRAVLATVSVTFGLGLVIAAQDQPPDLQDFLVNDIGLAPDLAATVVTGEVIAETLDTGVANEAAIIASVRIRATTEFFLRMYSDIERFETGWGVTKAISDPPQPSDFDAWIPSADDLADLRDCRVGNCDFQLGEESIRRMEAIDWSQDGAGTEATEALRSLAYQYVTGYTEGGNAQLGEYRYEKKPLSIRTEFESLVENSPYILMYRPALHQWLLDYPAAPLPGASDFLYWSSVELGPKPVMRINHVTVYPTGEGVNAPVIIASKQLFFSHYFNTGLELQILSQDPEFPDDGFYLTSLARYRSQSLTGMFGRMVKRTAVGAARDSIEVYLGRVKSATERYYQAEQQAR